MKNGVEEGRELDESGGKQEPTTSGSSSLRYLEEMGRLQESVDDMNAEVTTSLGLGPKSEDANGGSPVHSGGLTSGEDIRENAKDSTVPYRPRHRQPHRQILPRPSTAETSPPNDSKGKNQMLPRYWPRTDQEFQPVPSGDSNTVVTPLFEKVLSASDAGRIGRLVLPKACAEAHFPPISQPEGLPLRMSDLSGREWQFQFRFWPNNNSRMYVLEGVTPCIQAMRLQAGDTVTFGRLGSEGKLILGYRKTKDTGDGDYLPTGGRHGSTTSGKHSDHKSKSREAQALAADKRRGRPLGAKTKRFRIDNEDTLELKTSWEEAQELLRPPPGATPSFVTIDGHQFEEYEEPPVLTKKTITRTKSSGEQDRWVQCDDCGKYRRVPMEALLHTRWTCANNSWDQNRASCSAPKELNKDEMDQLLKIVAAGKSAANVGKQGDPVGLNALADAAVFGTEENKPASPPPPAPTTKHPRHRPGCTCIVCIQPPSGKGPKHKSTCMCNVCQTVKRRFKTLMMRRKKKQSEREAENAARKKKAEEGSVAPSGDNTTPKPAINQKESTGMGRGLQHHTARDTPPPGPGGPFAKPYMPERGKAGFPFPGVFGAGPFRPVVLGTENILSGKAGPGIDLNCQPDRDMESQGRISMMRLLQDANSPLELYLKQQGLASLVAPGVHPGVVSAFSAGMNDHVSTLQQQQQVHVPGLLSPPPPAPQQQQFTGGLIPEG